MRDSEPRDTAEAFRGDLAVYDDTTITREYLVNKNKSKSPPPLINLFPLLLTGFLTGTLLDAGLLDLYIQIFVLDALIFVSMARKTGFCVIFKGTSGPESIEFSLTLDEFFSINYIVR